MFVGINGHLEEMATASGYQKVVIGTFEDRHRRPVFQAFRLLKTTLPTGLVMIYAPMHTHG
jgi:hypothetical protein